jgi:hypothetical protein
MDSLKLTGFSLQPLASSAASSASGAAVALKRIRNDREQLQSLCIVGLLSQLATEHFMAGCVSRASIGFSAQKSFFFGDEPGAGRARGCQ